MLVLRLAVASLLEVRWPRSAQEILALLKRYLDWERAKLLAERLAIPAFTLVERVYNDAQTAADEVASYETARAQASESVDQILDASRPCLEVALLRLKGAHAHHLSDLEAWGVETKQGPRGIRVIKPRYREAWGKLLKAYVQKESSLTEAERQTDPPFVQMQEFATQLAAAETTRDSALAFREKAVERRDALCARGLDLVQLAAGVLVEIYFDGKLTREIEPWGYELVERTTPPEPVTPPTEPATPPA